MVSHSTIRGALAIGVAVLLAACDQHLQKPGDNGDTDTDATRITWTDGREAIRITCGMPGGCSTRALAICSGNYTVLSMTNMPTRGDAAWCAAPAPSSCAARPERSAAALGAPQGGDGRLRMGRLGAGRQRRLVVGNPGGDVGGHGPAFLVAQQQVIAVLVEGQLGIRRAAA